MIALLAEVENIRKLYLLSVLTAVLNIGFCASKIFLELHFVFIWYFQIQLCVHLSLLTRIL